RGVKGGVDPKSPRWTLRLRSSGSPDLALISPETRWLRFERGRSVDAVRSCRMSRAVGRALGVRAVVAVLGCLAGAVPAGARIELDYTTVGTFSQQYFYENCGVSVRGSAQMNVNPAAGPGIAVAGGDDASLDDGETLTFQFFDALSPQPATATDITYIASAASGGGSAAISIEAFDSGNVSLGTQPFSGTTEQSISAAFGGAPIGSLVMTANADPVRIERIAFTPLPGTGISVGWAYGGAYQRDQIDLCGLALTGSNTLYVGGLGAAGGGGVG